MLSWLLSPWLVALVLPVRASDYSRAPHSARAPRHSRTKPLHAACPRNLDHTPYPRQAVRLAGEA